MSIRFTKKWGRPFSGPKLEEVRSHGTAGNDGVGNRRALILGERCDDRHKPAWTRVATGLCHEPRHQSKAPNCDARHWRCQQLGILPACDKSIPQRVLSVEGAMIDALVNVAVFAALGLCIVGFGAWAHRRVDAQ